MQFHWGEHFRLIFHSILENYLKFEISFCNSLLVEVMYQIPMRKNSWVFENYKFRFKFISLDNKYYLLSVHYMPNKVLDTNRLKSNRVVRPYLNKLKWLHFCFCLLIYFPSGKSLMHTKIGLHLFIFVGKFIC